MKWFILSLSRWQDYKGRSRRKEFLFFFLFNSLFWYIPFITIELRPEVYILHISQSVWDILFFLPLIVRRLHDTGRSAWWLLLFFIFIFFKSNEGENRFGKNPITKNEDFKTLSDHFHS